MARSYRYLHLDVFTDRLFGGNQLAVFLDARDLSAETMQAVAKEMNFSESTFILPPERPDTSVRMRIFTPGSELPMAGHPTVGSTFALAHAGVIAASTERFVFGLGVGPTPVTLEWRDGDLDFVWMTQLPPTFVNPLVDRMLTARALSLAADALMPELPIQVVSCGLPYVLVPLTTRRAVDAAVLDRPAYDELMDRTPGSGGGLFLFSPEKGSDEATAYSRMFAPAHGVLEDPATGSASGPLGCYLVSHALVGPDQAGAMLSLQGVKMGRPSHVHVSIGVQGGEIASVRVGGRAVLAGEGTLFIP
jgi:trans-2,3-dihydro-3-hydroxyanthranilate isomerase